MGGDGGRKEMGRGRLKVLVDNVWRTHVAPCSLDGEVVIDIVYVITYSTVFAVRP